MMVSCRSGAQIWFRDLQADCMTPASMLKEEVNLRAPNKQAIPQFVRANPSHAQC